MQEKEKDCFDETVELLKKQKEIPPEFNETFVKNFRRLLA